MTMNGIDVSNWQAGINLEAVPADFVIMKATQGRNYVSPDCDRQYQQAKRAGRQLGVYHYVDGSGATAEADYFVDNIKGYVGDAVLAIDWEQEQNNAWGNYGYLKELVRRVIARTGVKPLLYSMQSIYSDIAAVAKELDCGLWIAQYADMNQTGYQAHPWNEGSYACAIRQYSSAGNLNGYDGNLDLNIAYMDKDAWLRYAKARGKTQSAQASKPAASKPSASTGSRTYTVQAGDTLSGIAAKYGTTYQHLAQINGISDPNVIYAGQVIKID